MSAEPNALFYENFPCLISHNVGTNEEKTWKSFRMNYKWRQLKDSRTLYTVHSHSNTYVKCYWIYTEHATRVHHCGCFVSFTVRKFVISLFCHHCVGRCWNANRESLVRNFVRQSAIHFANRLPMKISIEWKDVCMKSILIQNQMQYSCYNDIIDWLSIPCYSLIWASQCWWYNIKKICHKTGCYIND